MVSARFPLYRLSEDWKASLQSIVFLPVFLAITLGQDTPFILLAVLLWARLLNEKKDVWAGTALSLSSLEAADCYPASYAVDLQALDRVRFHDCVGILTSEEIQRRKMLSDNCRDMTVSSEFSLNVRR